MRSSSLAIAVRTINSSSSSAYSFFSLFPPVPSRLVPQVKVFRGCWSLPLSRNLLRATSKLFDCSQWARHPPVPSEGYCFTCNHLLPMHQIKYFTALSGRSYRRNKAKPIITISELFWKSEFLKVFCCFVHHIKPQTNMGTLYFFYSVLLIYTFCP